MNQPILDKVILAPLCEDDIRKHLLSLGIDHINKLLVFPSVASTNDYLLEHKFDDEKIVVCMAEQQTQGRGRYGHQWVSPLGVNLYLSMSWSLQTWAEKYETLSLWLLVAIAKLLEKHGCANVQLKWPNDICVENKKIAGILIERKVGGNNKNLIVGVGINVAMSTNKGVDVETPWIDLVSVHPGWQLSRNELAAGMVAVFIEMLNKLEGNQLQNLTSNWNHYDMLLNKQIEFYQQDKKRTACVKGINERGEIILDAEGKLENLHHAHMREIRLIGNEF